MVKRLAPARARVQLGAAGAQKEGKVQSFLQFSLTRTEETRVDLFEDCRGLLRNLRRFSLIAPEGPTQAMQILGVFKLIALEGFDQIREMRQSATGRSILLNHSPEPCAFCSTGHNPLFQLPLSVPYLSQLAFPESADGVGQQSSFAHDTGWAPRQMAQQVDDGRVDWRKISHAEGYSNP